MVDGIIYYMQRLTLEEIIERLKHYRPYKVILFGSRAKGKATSESDYDILVLKETKEDYWTRIRKVRKLLKGAINVDIFVFTPQEVAKALKECQPFIYDVFKEGKIVYEKAR